MKRGRKLLLNNKIIASFCEALSIGASQKLAAQYAGVSEAAVINWLNQGREWAEIAESGGEVPPEKKIFVKLLSETEQANAEAGITWLQVVDKAAQIDPAWAWRMLKVRYPDGFVEIDRTEITGKGGDPLEIVVEYAEAENND